MKLVVFFIFLCDVCSAIFTIAWMYFLFISHWGDLVAFSQTTWMLSTDPLILGLMTCATHFFFARRIYVITGNIWLAGIICIFGLGTLAGALAAMISFLQVSSLADLTSLKPIAIVWLLFAAVGDVTITLIMSWSLRKRKSGFQRTDQLVDRVIRVTVQNGLLTSLMATAALVLYLSTDIPYHLALSLVLPRMYSNTMLSSFNYRDVSKTDATNEYGGASSLSNGLRRTQQTEVVVHVEAHELADATKSERDWELSGKTHAV
ncbi:hypothetical protein EVJ58_g7644 [Rhodofomes roseus]|nr:hypothetical protein EVJ58_g7644 [Rhodofomes roseus]